MLPSPSVFEDYIGNLGIDNDTHVVVYDTSDFALFSAQRLWWTFRVFGHTSVSLLEGGFNQWVKDGYETTQDMEQVQPTKFKATFNAHMVKSFEDLERNITEKKFTVIDARAAPRFEGTGPEPRPGKSIRSIFAQKAVLAVRNQNRIVFFIHWIHKSVLKNVLVRPNPKRIV